MNTSDPILTHSYEDKDNTGIPTDPLTITIEDDELVKIIDKRVKDSKDFFGSDKINLYERRKKNEIMLFGRQLLEKEKNNELKGYEVRYLDNALYEIEASIKPVALSKLPDLIVTPGQDTPESAETAKNVSMIVNNDLKKRENRRVLSIAFKHQPVYFTGIIKVRWDKNKGEFGDYVFENVHPDNITVDHTCITNDADKMGFIAEDLPCTVQDVLLNFSEKKEDFISELQKNGIKVQEEPTYKDLATPIKIKEVWLEWFEKDTKDKEKQSRINGVIWKYGSVILKKTKNPNYDYQGKEKLYIYDVPGDESTKREMGPQDMMSALMTGGMTPNIQAETVYANYFDAPKKPYYFMGYDQWSKMAYDETSRIEQNILNQQDLDKRGKQITETLNERGKHIISKKSGITATDMEQMDLSDPNQDVLVDGDVNAVHTFLPPNRPTPAEFQDKLQIRDRMFSLSGATNLNGMMQSDVATTNQIARESNFSRIDDLTEDTVNAAAEWMGGWIMQFIKLRYTEEHMRKLLGSKGQVTFVKLKNDMIEDGMEVMIKASSTDKMRAQKNALDMAKLGPPFINPIDFFKDMDMDDPEGRAERGVMFAMDPNMYMSKYIMGLKDTEMMGAALNGQMPIPNPLGGQPPAGATPMKSQQPQQPAPQNPGNVPIQPPVLPTGSARGI
jgi:hypothetical protein